MIRGLVETGRRCCGCLRADRTPYRAAVVVPGCASRATTTRRTSARVQISSDARVWRAGGRTHGHGTVRATGTAARGRIPHILVTVRVHRGTAVIRRRGCGSGLGTILVVVRCVGVVVIVIVRAVVDLAAGRRDGRVVGRLLRGPGLMQVVVRVRRHAQGQREATVR